MFARRTKGRTGERVLSYLIPILIGMGGLLFSKQVGSAGLRMSIVVVSVSVPLFAGGVLLARQGARGTGRLVLLAGMVFLLIGAAASISDFWDVMAQQQVLSQSVTDASRWLGMCSLFLGLFVVLYSVARTGEAIEEIGERFRHLADLMSEGFILSSPTGMIILVNQRFLDLFDITEDMVLGENAAELVARLKVDSMKPHIDLRSHGLASEYEMTWQVRGEERQFWVSGTPIFDRRGRHTGTLATVRDTTDRNRMAKRLERYAKGLQELVEEQTQKLTQSETQFRDLLLHMNEGFMTLDSSYRVQFANNRICEMLRVTPHTIFACEVFDFVDPAGRVRLMERLKAEQAGQPIGFRQEEFSFLTADGSPVSVVVAVAPVQEPVETDTSYSLVITDVSEIKRMQRQLELRAAELETANEELRAHGRAKDGFLSNVSHELKTPLSTINGYVEMLESGSLGDLQPPQLSALKVMGRNVKRLVGLINEMIEFSRMEIRGIQLKTSLFNIGKLARESVASAQPQALTKDLSVSMFVPDAFPPVWADREKIGQVLGILLSNAVKFSQEGGMIQLRVMELPDHTLGIGISDTGIGIDPAFHHRVFEKFFQVDGSMTRRYEGAGIGLSIAKSIMEAHGGGIQLESEPNKGSTFTLLLPHAVFDSTVAPARAVGLEGLRVLIVGEGDTFRRTLNEVLQRTRCQLDEAVNGYECLRQAEEAPPDVIVFDELLSDVAGPATITSLRQDPSAETIPIILMTGEDTGKIRQALELAHDIHFLLKPFNAQDLVVRIREVCLGEEARLPIGHAAALPIEPKVLVIDPDPDFQAWVQAALQRRHIVSRPAMDLSRALELAESSPPDVVFLDMDAPASLTARLLAGFRESKTAHDVPVCIMTGLPAMDGKLPEGTLAVLRKPFGIEEMVRLVDDLHSAAVP